MPKHTLKDIPWTKQQLQMALESLRSLLDMVLSNSTEGLNPGCGICYNWMVRIQAQYPNAFGAASLAHNLTSLLAASWPKSQWPGMDVSWPVPADPMYRMWEGPNKALRISLMRYMIKRLRDKIRRMP